MNFFDEIEGFDEDLINQFPGQGNSSSSNSSSSNSSSSSSSSSKPCYFEPWFCDPNHCYWTGSCINSSSSSSNAGNSGGGGNSGLCCSRFPGIDTPPRCGNECICCVPEQHTRAQVNYLLLKFDHYVRYSEALNQLKNSFSSNKVSLISSDAEKELYSHRIICELNGYTRYIGDFEIQILGKFNPKIGVGRGGGSVSVCPQCNCVDGLHGGDFSFYLCPNGFNIKSNYILRESPIGLIVKGPLFCDSFKKTQSINFNNQNQSYLL